MKTQFQVPCSQRQLDIVVKGCLSDLLWLQINNSYNYRAADNSALKFRGTKMKK